jgi:hypothetical protein
MLLVSETCMLLVSILTVSGFAFTSWINFMDHMAWKNWNSKTFENGNCNPYYPTDCPADVDAFGPELLTSIIRFTGFMKNVPNSD